MVIKRGFLAFFLFLALIFPVSAAVIIDTQPAAIYNLGDIATIKVTFKPTQAVSGNFQMDLLCSANTVNFYKSGMQVPAGTEKVIESSLVLIKEVIGENTGACSIRAYLGADSVNTNEFIISNTIKINATVEKTSFMPEETIIIKGTAVKENGQKSNGYLQVDLVADNLTVATQSSTINNGAFTASIAIPKDARSGSHFLKITAQEESVSGEITNAGSFDIAVSVNQVPTTLELVFDHDSSSNEIEFLPGEELRVKPVLRDQAGMEIPSEVFVTIKNSKNKIVEQLEVPTGKFVEFPIKNNEAPAVWKVVALSNKLNTESSFSILEKASIDIKIENNTILVTNTGNIPYNETVLVKVGSQSLNIDVQLGVDESRRWLVTAPDGQYDLSVVSQESTIRSTVALTGDAIDVRRASEGLLSLTKFPSVWIFIILVLGVMTTIVFRRGYQKAFIGYITSNLGRKEKEAAVVTLGSGAFGIAPKAKAELMVSIKGEKQEVSLVTLNVKNLAWMKNVKEGSAALDTMNKVKRLAEENKAATYENGENTFFIFAPSRTKTFKNEPTALNVARQIKSTLDHHNKMFSQKIDFGISLNIGEIIAKQESDGFKFTGMGNLMNSSKKIASLAENDIFMGEKITDKLKTAVKVEKHEREGTRVYSIKEVRDADKHEKFLKGFMKRQEK